MKTPEFWEKKTTDEFLKEIGAFNAKPNSGGYGTSGNSDRLCCIKGKFVAIEVKRPGKEPTPIQWRRIREVEAAGGVAFWGDAEKIIGEIKAWLGTVP